MTDKNLSSRGILIESIKKAIKKYDKNISSDVAYQLINHFDQLIREHQIAELKIKLHVEVQNFKKQYRALFNDYAALHPNLAEQENAFSVVTDNPISSYNKITELMQEFQRLNPTK